MRYNYWFAIVGIVVLGSSCVTTGKPDFHLTLLHTNDVHARLLPINEFDQTCDENELKSGKCVGGVARRFTKIQEIRQTKDNVLLVDAGDEFQGTLFYAKYKGDEAKKFMNEMDYAAMAVGNHEFDDGPANLGRFVKAVQFPVLSANLDVSREPTLAGLIKPYTVVSLGGKRVGIVGCTTEETKQISSPGPNVIFLPIEEALQKNIDELRAQGIHRIVVLSHAGFSRDLEIARRVSGIDVLVAGHSNTFLSNTDPTAEGPYPVVVTSPEGEPVLIVSAYAYSKYLGEIDIEFDEDGKAIAWKGEPILLDASIPENEMIKKQVAELEAPLEAMRHEVVARLPVNLDGGSQCRYGECSLGDVLSDAMLYIAKPYGAQVVLMNGGGIRTGLAKGTVTRWQVIDALPFGNEIATFDLNGQELWDTLEFGVSYSATMGDERAARFPQVAGLRYVWIGKNPEGKKIQSVEVMTKDGKYRPLRRDQIYRVAVNRFMLDGGDGYDLSKGRNVEILSETLDQALIKYVAQPKFKIGKLGDRITMN